MATNDLILKTADPVALERDIGKQMYHNIADELNIKDVPEEELCVISPEHGDYFDLCINGNYKRLPTGYKLHLTVEQRNVLRDALPEN